MINISYRYRCFLWLPPKTGTMRACDIFKCFDFISRDEFTVGNDKINPKVDKLVHNHHMNIFEGSENYRLICTARNPYSWMVSYYKMCSNELKIEMKENFINFLERFFYPNVFDKIYSEERFSLNENWRLRKPDYYIRMETMYEDYLKIPFIKDTEIYKNSKLKDMCNSKKNENNLDLRHWKNFYTEESANIVYHNFEDYFEMLEYDKNSYKQ